jgi:hypothetical protein
VALAPSESSSENRLIRKTARQRQRINAVELPSNSTIQISLQILKQCDPKFPLLIPLWLPARELFPLQKLARRTAGRARVAAAIGLSRTKGLRAAIMM